MLSLRDPGTATVPVIATTATEGRGVAELNDAVEARARALGGSARAARTPAQIRHQIADSAAELLRRHLNDSDEDESLRALCRAVRHLNDSDDDGLRALCRAVRRGEMDPDGAARRYLSKRMTGSALTDDDA
jgi:putative protein kinase ArgK-like GTPase of G3E family